MPGRGAKQLKREWIESDDSDDNKSKPAVRQEGTGKVADAGAGMVTIPDPSERAETRHRIASELLANSSDDESGAQASHVTGDGLHVQSRMGAAIGQERGGRIRNRIPRAKSAGEDTATVPEDLESSIHGRKSSVQTNTNRNTAAQHDAAGGESPGKEQFHKRRVHTVSSHVSRVLRHTSPGANGSPLGTDVRDSDSEDGPSWGGAHHKKPHSRKQLTKPQRRSDDDDEDSPQGAKRPTAAEVAEALRKKKKTQMAITDCLKQAMVLNPSLLFCPTCLIACPSDTCMARPGTHPSDQSPSQEPQKRHCAPCVLPSEPILKKFINSSRQHSPGRQRPHQAATCSCCRRCGDRACQWR